MTVRLGAQPSAAAMLARIFFLLAVACLVAGHSHRRNPLRSIHVIQNPSIHTQTRRVTALSQFDLSFDLLQGSQRIRLSLEPNHDAIADGAVVSYLSADGTITRTETIDRLDHKVYKGVAKEQRDDGSWEPVGWARIVVTRDGPEPLFEGAFSVRHDHHHVLLDSSFEKTRGALDPPLPSNAGEAMVLFRDSDIAGDDELYRSGELKRSEGAMACGADRLEFNSRPDHPVYVNMRRGDADMFGSVSMGELFGKRQIDQQGTGNGAGVDLKTTIGNPAGCPGTRKVALVGVATDCSYTAMFHSHRETRQNVIKIVNAASSVWESTFNISLGLSNLTISDARCPGSPAKATPWNQGCSNSVDITKRLNMFSGWRGTQQDSNAYWTLMTNCRTADEVGLAWLGLACVKTATTSNTTGGGQETASGTNVVAFTDTEWQVMAHETGHTFGAVHDCTSQTCSDGYTVQSQQCCPLSTTTCDAGQQYIMNPVSIMGLSQFSLCTLGNICSGIGRNAIDTTCLSANTGVVTITGAVCGNGIVEQGEQCDCGGVAGCVNDPCCNAKTCQFTAGSVCDDANENCCTNCQFSRNGTVCRPSSGFCDPQEVCTGESGVCPLNKMKPNGVSCHNPAHPNDHGLTCASGQCTSRNLQCQTVMAAYMKSGNDTYACDQSTCVMSCASPAFSPGTCYGLQQNLLDGTPCLGGGHCKNGQCVGTSVGKEIVGWLQTHLPIVIGISCVLGVLLLVTVVGCITGCVRRRRHRKRLAAAKEQALMSGGLGGAPPGGLPGDLAKGSTRALDGTWYGPPSAGAAFTPKPSSFSSPFPPPPPPPLHMTQSAQQRSSFSDVFAPPPGPPPSHRGASQPVSPVSPVSAHAPDPWANHDAAVAAAGWRPPPVHRPYSPARQGMYGNGIIGARAPASPGSGSGGGNGGSGNPFAPPRPPPRVYSPPTVSGSPGGVRYA